MAVKKIFASSKNKTKQNVLMQLSEELNQENKKKPSTELIEMGTELDSVWLVWEKHFSIFSLPFSE